MNARHAPAAMRARLSIAAAALCGAAFAVHPARADDAPPTLTGDLTERDVLTGDWGGGRTKLRDSGVEFEATFTGDASLNTSGGFRRDQGFSGLLQLGLTLDLEKIAGWQGGEIYAGAYVIRGHGLSQYELGNLFTISNIENPRATRLGEVYFKQTLLDDRLEIKAGQLAADGDFATSDTAGLFVNSTFGWPGLFALDIVNGGPSYPLPTPGAHVAFKFDDAWSLQAGVYNGDPFGADGLKNDHNLDFPVGDGTYAIGELAYANEGALPGVYKVGAWYNSHKVADLLTGATRKGSYAFYGVIDQTVWMAGDLKDPSPASLSVFARGAIAPQENRNLMDVYFDVGFNFKGVPARPDDVFGVAFAYGHISDRQRDLDRTTPGGRVSKPEMVVEASYAAQLLPSVKLQPYVQYVINPNGGLNPFDATRKNKDATVLGFRTQVSF